MKTIRKINIESKQNYFFNDMTNINDSDLNLLNIDQVLFKDLNSLNSLYLVFNNLDSYIEKSGEDRYLIFASTEKNKMMLENYT